MRRRHFGKYFVTPHTRNEYRVRVSDDANRHEYSGNEIAKIIRNVLNEIVDVDSLPRCGYSRIAEVRFRRKKMVTQPYYIAIQKDLTGGCEYVAASLWTKEIYEEIKKRQTDFRDTLAKQHE